MGRGMHQLKGLNARANIFSIFPWYSRREGQQSVEYTILLKGFIETLEIIGRRNLDAPKPPQMGGGSLGIEQFISALPQAIHEVYECQFAGVAAGVEHAFTEKCSTKTDTVQTADQFVFPPGFDAVSETNFMQPQIGGDQFFVDPRSICAGIAAGLHRRAEIVIESDLEFPWIADKLGEGMGDVEGVEGNDAARVSGVPADEAVAVGHGEDALGVGGEEGFGVEAGFGHGHSPRVSVTGRHDGGRAGAAYCSDASMDQQEQIAGAGGLSQDVDFPGGGKGGRDDCAGVVE